jgi:hypothetical protein
MLGHHRLERLLQLQPIGLLRVRTSGGVPEALLGMLEAVAAEDEITPARVRSFQHDAAKRYFDMTPVVLLAMLGFIALRYVTRGLDEQKLWVWAGLGTTL